MHKKPVLQGCGSGTPLGQTPPRRVTGSAALRLALALGVLGGWQWGPRLAWADGDPIAPASEISTEAIPATTSGPGASPTEPAKPAAPAPPVPNTGPAASPNAGPATGPVSPETAGREDRFRDLERRTFELKDQVFRAKARLTLLSETLVSANVGTTRVAIVHQNQMGRLFQPIRVSYQIDGREVFTADESVTAVTARRPGHQNEDPAGIMSVGKDLPVWEGGLKPGEHTVGVTVVYRGNGAKVLAYYDKYNFTARAAHHLTAVEGQTTRLVVRCYEKGNALTAKLEDRPEFEFKVAVANATASGTTAGKAAATDPPAGKRPDDPPAEAKAK